MTGNRYTHVDDLINTPIKLTLTNSTETGTLIRYTQNPDATPVLLELDGPRLIPWTSIMKIEPAGIYNGHCGAVYEGHLCTLPYGHDGHHLEGPDEIGSFMWYRGPRP